MLQNAFAGHAQRPTERELASVLGHADALWHRLVTDLKRDLKLDAEEWNSYSVKAGWSLRLQLKKRNIVYLSPGNECFLVSFAFGDKAVAAARTTALPPGVLKNIEQAKRYAEGTAVLIEVHDATDASRCENTGEDQDRELNRQWITRSQALWPAPSTCR